MPWCQSVQPLFRIVTTAACSIAADGGLGQSGVGADSLVEMVVERIVAVACEVLAPRGAEGNIPKPRKVGTTSSLRTH